MEGIPEDVIVQILLRSPVKALLRFRCVSKRWRNLIDSPNFVNSQLNLPNKPQSVMVLVFNETLRLCYAELDSDYIENRSPNFRELTLPFPVSNVSSYVGHCNGLLCCVCETNYTFLVFNPFIGKHILVPPPPEQEECWWEAWGFGYDRDSDDYKVVTLAYERMNIFEFPGVVWIYSIKSCSWKRIADFPYIPVHDNGVFVNGALHWIVSPYKGDPSKLFIFALNLGNLEYRLVPLPSDNSRNMSYLGVLDGCLYAICSSGVFDKIDCYDLWVMKEYGLKESWTRLRTYDGQFNDRELHFVCYGGSLVECKFASFWGESMGGKPLVYEPSLVWARSGI